MWHRAKITIVVLSLMAVTLPFLSASFLTTLDCTLLMVCPVALVHTLKGNRAQLSLYLQQVEMILAAALLYMKHDDSMEADLTVGTFLFMCSEVYLSF